MDMEMIRIYTLTFLLNILFVSISFAAHNKVLIINTNSAVSRYEKIAAEFKNTLPKNAYQWLEFNVEAHGNPDNDLQQLIQTEKPDIIYCIGSKAYSLSQNYVSDKFLIFSAAINWQRLNINDKTYGVSNELAPEQEITLLRLFFPQVKKIAVLYSKEFTQEYIETLKKVTVPFNIQIIERQITNPAQISPELNELLPKTDMLWMIADPLVLENEAAVLQILQTAKQQKKPVYAFSDSFVRHGAALSIAPSLTTIGGQSANLLMSLKEGKIPEDRVKFPAGSSITLNMCTFETLKLPLSKEALSSVEQIIPCPAK